MPGKVAGRTDYLKNLHTGLLDLGFSPAVSSQNQMCLLEMDMSETLNQEEPCFSLLSLTRDSSRIHEPLGFCKSPKLPKCVILQRIFAAQLNPVSYLPSLSKYFESLCFNL